MALTSLTMAETFRDEGKDVLFFVDNIYRFTRWRYRSVRSAGAVCLPPWATSPLWPMGPPAGALRLDQRVGSIRANSRPFTCQPVNDRPFACYDVRPLGLHRCAVA